MEYALRALFFDLWLPSQFLQGKLVITWHFLYVSLNDVCFLSQFYNTISSLSGICLACPTSWLFGRLPFVLMLGPSGGSFKWEATRQPCIHGGFHGVFNHDESWCTVSHHLEKAAEVAVGFGVAVPEELREVAEEICNKAVMKPLERKRFLALLRPE